MKCCVLLGLVLISWLLPQRSVAQWIAFKDHAAGPGTHANATRYHILGEESGTTGFLKDIFTGQNLPVQMTITRSGTAQGDPAGGIPAPDTPLDKSFGGIVAFTGAVRNNVGTLGTATVTFTFSGLDPEKSYRFVAGAVRGSLSLSNRWTLAALQNQRHANHHVLFPDMVRQPVPNGNSSAPCAEQSPRRWRYLLPQWN